MKIQLRFGMHKDIEVIHQARDLIDGLVIPMHILAHQTASTAAFICSLPSHEYVIDPMTWILQNPRERHRRDDGSLRPSVGKWCDALHADLRKTLSTGVRGAPLTSSELPDLKACCEGNFRFQTETVNVGHIDPRAKKYLDRYGMTLATRPRCVLSPYYQFQEVGDIWYTTTLEAAKLTQAIDPSANVAPVIMCSSTALNAAAAVRIASDFGTFKRCFVWIESLSQGAANSGEIKRVIELVSALAARGVAVETLYGGFMMMLMEYRGMVAISHGILYTQDKASEQVPGGGAVPERYYIPAFHDFRSLSQANLILKKHPELAGGTPTAESVMSGDPDRIYMFASRPELLRRHFLEARRRECQTLASTKLEDVLRRLRDTYGKYHDSVSKLPNPDAVVTGGEQKGLDYLMSWVNAFS